jgi:hypothetical protein
VPPVQLQKLAVDLFQTDKAIQAHSLRHSALQPKNRRLCSFRVWVAAGQGDTGCGFLFFGFWDCFRAVTFFLVWRLAAYWFTISSFGYLKPLLTQFAISVVLVMPLFWLS